MKIYNVKHKGLALKLFISTIIILFVIRSIDFDFTKFIARLTINSSLYILSAMLGFPILMFFKAYRWNVQLKDCGIDLSVRYCFKVYMSSFFFGVVTPGRFGELAKAYYLKSDLGIDLPTAFRTVIVDRGFDLLFLFCFGTVGFINISGYRYFGNWIVQFVMIFAAMILLFLFVVKIFRLISFRGRKLSTLKYILENIINDCCGRHSVIYWIITFLSYAIYFGICYLLLCAINVNLPFMTLNYIISFVSLLLLLPISYLGIGPRELTLVYFMSLYGIESSDALFYSLLQFFLFFIYGGILGALFLIFAPIPIKKLRDQTDELNLF